MGRLGMAPLPPPSPSRSTSQAADPQGCRRGSGRCCPALPPLRHDPFSSWQPQWSFRNVTRINPKPSLICLFKFNSRHSLQATGLALPGTRDACPFTSCPLCPEVLPPGSTGLALPPRRSRLRLCPELCTSGRPLPAPLPLSPPCYLGVHIFIS